MAINETPVDSGVATASGGTSVAPALAGTASSGNLLVACVAIQTETADGFATPSGWTLANKWEDGNVSQAVFYKTSDGTETGVTMTWGPDSRVNRGWIGEWASTDLDLGTAPLLAEDESNVTTVVTSQDSGTTASTTVADALCIAFFSAQNSNNVNGGRSYTAGYTEQYFPGSTTRCSIGVVTEVVASTGAQSCTFTTTDTGDDQYGQILVFQGPAAGGVTNNYHYRMNQ